jgi:threonine synthase
LEYWKLIPHFGGFLLEYGNHDIEGSLMKVFCTDCGKTASFNPRQFSCECGGAWEPEESDSFDKSKIDSSKLGLWRYQDIFALDEVKDPFTLGAGWTPLVEANINGRQTHFKLEFMAPTGSFKDRGTEVEINFLQACGIRDVVEDSSGNAGASMAAYAARAGLKAAIYAPESASPAKLAQIGFFGAELHKIPGLRSETTKAALKAVEQGAIYASHAYNPVYLLGQQSFAWEVWEQFETEAPDAVVIPVGQGGLLIGAWLGFRRLMRAGLIKKMPMLFAVQPKLLSPIYAAWSADLAEIPEISPSGVSQAEGLAIIKPVRGKRILQALRESSGGALTVTEDEIKTSWQNLALNGLFAEPTSAAAAAALPQVYKAVGENAKVVVALTGSGLKSPPKG